MTDRRLARRLAGIERNIGPGRPAQPSPLDDALRYAASLARLRAAMSAEAVRLLDDYVHDPRYMRGGRSPAVERVLAEMEGRAWADASRTYIEQSRAWRARRGQDVGPPLEPRCPLMLTDDEIEYLADDSRRWPAGGHLPGRWDKERQACARCAYEMLAVFDACPLCSGEVGPSHAVLTMLILQTRATKGR